MRDPQAAAEQTSTLRITKDRLNQWSACSDGYRWFLDHFPQGADYGQVQAALRADRRYDDARWLTERAFACAMDAPAATPEITADAAVEAQEIIAETTSLQVEVATANATGSTNDGGQDYARIGSSGNDARIGSSGNYARIGSSGYDARIGSSGYDARIGSSGYDARIGSSGNGAQINAEGANAVIASAGLNARVRSGDGGAVALAYHDGTRTRFAVGYVGEGIKPLTWYRVGSGGEFVECEEVAS